jgi:hypothetical protein
MVPGLRSSAELQALVPVPVQVQVVVLQVQLP